MISMCYYYLAKEEYNNNYDNDAESYLLQSIDYFSNSSISDYNKRNIKTLLSNTYERLGNNRWNKNYESDMLKSIDYYKKADQYNVNSNNSIIQKKNNFEEYYYLYKAYSSYNYQRKDYLYNSYSLNGDYSNNIRNLYNTQNNCLSFQDNINYYNNNTI